tara:strand:+ start:109 stop:666 length:558 start_codon:yes stop_codon:yes gene_type:complete
MKRFVFLDRDGVINTEINFLHKKEDLELIEGSGEAIRLLNENGWKVIIVSNQPVVARGLCTEEYSKEIGVRLKEMLAEKGARVDRTYYCPHHPKKGENPKYTRECECRKPKPGMILAAKKHFGIEDLSECYMVGDTIGDILTGDRAGCKTILVETGHGGKGIFNDAVPQHTVKNLKEAVEKIILK